MTQAGTTPPGATNEQQAARWVRGMFGRVAGRYDLLNHMLSFQADRYWRAHTVSRVAETLRRPNVRALDLCCGTGDLLLSLRKSTRGSVLGIDFCHPMLVEAQRKIGKRGLDAPLIEADALCMPLPAGAVDLVTIAFGFRNFANYEDGLRELRRLIRPGGCLAILEFSQPSNRLFAALYRFYSKQVLPRIGGLVSGDPDAYSYLPESVEKFPAAEELALKIGAAGFSEVTFERMTFGVVALHLAYVR